jgi:hypothetical protein
VLYTRVEEISNPLNLVSSQLFSSVLRKYSKIPKEKRRGGHANSITRKVTYVLDIPNSIQ